MTPVELKDVVVRYTGHGVPALSVPSFAVAPGEILAVVGASGSGKSTLLRVVAGLIRRPGDASLAGRVLERLAAPASAARMSGAVLFGGRDVGALAPRLRRVAYAAQSLNLYPHMTGRENLAFPLRMARAAGADARVAPVARRLRIEHLLDRRPGQLSGGEQQRIALGKTLVQDAAVRLFDEPLSSLDAPLRASFCRELRAWLREPRATALYVTHDLDEAFAVGDRVAVIDGGEVRQIGAPEALYAAPASVEVARLVWGNRAAFLPADVERNGSGVVVRIGASALKVSAEAAGAVRGAAWVAAPTEAFALAAAGAGTSSTIRCTVRDVRFASTRHIVEVAGDTFTLEVEARRPAVPEVGRQVDVAIDFGKVSLFPRAAG